MCKTIILNTRKHGEKLRKTLKKKMEIYIMFTDSYTQYYWDTDSPQTDL